MPIDVIHINTKLPLNCFKAASGDWIGVCQPLGITVQAETWSELMEDIGYTLDAMFQDLLTSNELDRFLRDHGWEAVGQIPTQPDRAVRFDVPFIPALVGTPA
jgi:predicted RNase H-like HicB family nuclease